MLMIRLQRVGKKNQAMFRLVLTEKQNGPKSGRFTELLGSYNPHSNEIKFNTERIQHWIGNGAQASDTVHNLLVKEGIIKGDKKNVLPKKTPIKKEGEEVEGGEEKVASEESTQEAPAEEDKTSAEPASEEENIEEKPAEEAPAEEEKVEEPKEEAKEEESSEEKPEESNDEDKKES